MCCAGTDDRDMIKVLHIEPDEGYVRRLPRMLRRSQWGPYEVEFATTLKEATEKLTTSTPDAVVMELELPDSEGLKAVYCVKKAGPQVPVLVYTAMEEEKVASKTIREGAQDFLPKASTTSFQLSRAIVYALERQKLINRAARLQKQLVGSERDRAVVETARAAVREIEPSLQSLDVEVGEMESDGDVDEIVRRIEAVRNTLDELFASVDRLDRVYRYVAEDNSDDGRKVNLNAATFG
ncbi:MAG: response regulator [Planctomycetota bacterium]